MAIDYNDILLNAVDILIGQRISELPYDRTVICTIIDDSKSNEGIYTVLQDSTISYEVKSEKTNYKKD
jgi:hypothetical protein